MFSASIPKPPGGAYKPDSDRQNNCRGVQVVGHAFPLFAQIIANGQKTCRPDASSGIGIHGERFRVQPTGSGDESRKMPNSGDEITKKQSPFAEAVKPSVGFGKWTLFFGYFIAGVRH